MGRYEYKHPESIHYLPYALVPGQWVKDAACSIATAELFFSRVDDQKSTFRAKRICARCPVLEECRTWALTAKPAYGIWGGMTEGERQRLRWGAAAQDSAL